MVLFSSLVLVSVSELLLTASMRESSLSILSLFFILIEINIEETWLHKYVDENGSRFVVAMPINSLNAFWVIF
jgi:hypothetical protein